MRSGRSTNAEVLAEVDSFVLVEQLGDDLAELDREVVFDAPPLREALEERRIDLRVVGTNPAIAQDIYNFDW